MGEMRILLGDRWSGGVLAVVTAAFVLLQTMASAYACTLELTASPMPALVICHGAGVAVVDVSALPGRDQVPPVAGCPCGALCGVGIAFTMPRLASDPGAAYSMAEGVDLRFARDGVGSIVPHPAEAPPFPTGPPLIST